MIDFISQAKWIWPENTLYLVNSYAGFRYDFELKKQLSTAHLHLTAEQSYRLWINGRHVCRGPVRGHQKKWFYDTVDVAHHLRQGHNFIAVEAFNPGITLYNCCAATVNANIKNDRMLNVINYAWGGRPLNYVNSKFIAGANPWGNEDLRYFPVKQFRKDVAKIRKDYDFYQSIKELQYEFIDDYEVLPNGGLKTVYSNGAVMLSNPTENEITAEGHTLIPFSNAVFR